MANVLVTGGAGCVGSVCCTELLRAGHSVVVVDEVAENIVSADRVLCGAFGFFRF